MKCSVCLEEFKENGSATLDFSRNGIVVTVTGVSAVAVCPSCGNAILDWQVAKQLEELVQPLFRWAEREKKKPIVNITIPPHESLPLAA